MRRQGTTLIELMLVASVLVILVAIFAPRASITADRRAVRRAANDVIAFYHTARFAAVFRGRVVRLELSSDSLLASFEGPDSLFAASAGPHAHGVSLVTNRPVIRFQPTGVGLGAANTTVALVRGRAVDSLVTSRLGRIRRAR